jgi:hypothetical protein
LRTFTVSTGQRESQSLAEAERLVAEGRRRLERQREIVAQMEHNDSNFTRASVTCSPRKSGMIGN